MYDFLTVKEADKLKNDHIVNVPVFSADLAHKDVRDLCVKASKDYPYHHLDLDTMEVTK